MKKIILTQMIIFLWFNGAISQFTKSIEISSYFDDNLYRSPLPVEDMLTNAGLKLSYELENSDLGFSYDGNFYNYHDNSLRNFSLHELGINYYTTLDDSEKNGLFLGADWTSRINGDEYNYYNYNQIFAYSNFQFDLNGLFLKTGYNFRYRGYSNLPDLTNYQHFIFMQINKSFPSRTTFILETHLGYKSFNGSEIFTSTNSSANVGRGHGRMSETNSSTTVTMEKGIPGLNQAIILARVSQSLHEKLGLFIQYRKQVSLTDKTEFSNSDGYYQDEELFDDPFSYESEGYSSQLTWILPWSMKIQIGGGIVSKNYISEQAYVSLEDTLASGGFRSDDYDNYHISFSKTFLLNKAWINSLHFSLNYSYIRNESNSYWYNYKNGVIGAGIRWSF